MNTLPSECIIQNILLQLSYPDLQNYCQINSNASNLCNDMIFWKTKLDYDFTTLGINGEKMIPSKYVIEYNNMYPESWKQVYHRWYNSQNKLIYNDIMYTDQIMWNLDLESKNRNELERIFVMAIAYNNTNVISELYTRYDIPSVEKFFLTTGLDVLEYTQIATIQWFISHNYLSKEVALMVAAKYGRPDILDLLG